MMHLVGELVFGLQESKDKRGPLLVREASLRLEFYSDEGTLLSGCTRHPEPGPQAYETL